MTPDPYSPPDAQVGIRTGAGTLRARFQWPHVLGFVSFGLIVGVIHYFLVYDLVMSSVDCYSSIDPCSPSPIKEAITSFLWGPLSDLPGTPIADYFGRNHGGIEAEEFELACDSCIWGASTAGLAWALLAFLRRGGGD